MARRVPVSALFYCNSPVLTNPHTTGKTMLLRAMSGLTPPVLSEGYIKRPSMHVDVLESNRSAVSSLEDAGFESHAAFLALVNRLHDGADTEAALSTAMSAKARLESAQTVYRESDKAPFCLYSPQVCYLSEGTLREQVTYPLSVSTKCDEFIEELLHDVGLGFLIERMAKQTPEWTKAWKLVNPTQPERLQGLHQRAQWAKMLSGGEQQRVALARILYHSPRYAFMDMATSALDAATERKCLRAIAQRGIKMVHVSGPATIAHHGAESNVLELTGSGGWGLSAKGTF